GQARAPHRGRHHQRHLRPGAAQAEGVLRDPAGLQDARGLRGHRDRGEGDGAMRGAALLGAALLGAALVLLGAGCGADGNTKSSDYFPAMARDPASKASAPTPVTRDGLTLQRPVPGTIARGYHPFHYGPGEPEAIRAGHELTNPFRATSQILDEGKGLYQT